MMFCGFFFFSTQWGKANIATVVDYYLVINCKYYLVFVLVLSRLFVLLLYVFFVLRLYLSDDGNFCFHFIMYKMVIILFVCFFSNSDVNF